MLIQQLMPLLVAHNNVQNQQNVQQLINALNIQQNVNQVVNQPTNVILAQQLIEQLNRNQPRQDNGAILQLIIQLLTNLGQPVVEDQVDEAQIVTPSLITIYRGVVNKMNLNIMIPKGSEKNYFLQFKNLELLELSLERGDSITFGLGPFRKSILTRVIVRAKEEIPIGEQEFIAELTDENHKVIQTSKTTVRIVAKEDETEETEETDAKRKVPPPILDAWKRSGKTGLPPPGWRPGRKEKLAEADGDTEYDRFIKQEEEENKRKIYTHFNDHELFEKFADTVNDLKKDYERSSGLGDMYREAHIKGTGSYDKNKYIYTYQQLGRAIQRLYDLMDGRGRIELNKVEQALSDILRALQTFRDGVMDADIHKGVYSGPDKNKINRWIKKLNGDLNKIMEIIRLEKENPQYEKVSSNQVVEEEE